MTKNVQTQNVNLDTLRLLTRGVGVWYTEDGTSKPMPCNRLDRNNPYGMDKFTRNYQQIIRKFQQR